MAAARKTAARGTVAEQLRSRGSGGPERWVRVNPLDGGGVADLAAVVAPGLDGVVLPKIDGVGDVVRLGHYLDALECRAGMAPGSVRILPIATETPRAPFGLGGFAERRLPRLHGLTWGPEDLGTALGASTNHDETGEFAFTYRMVRSLCLMAARAAGVEPVDTLHADFRDLEGLARTSATAARDGFTGRLAIHPDQVPVINRAFSPSDADVERARRVLAAFAAAPDAGVVGLDGKMLDVPHLKQAERVLARHAAHTGRS